MGAAQTADALIKGPVCPELGQTANTTRKLAETEASNQTTDTLGDAAEIWHLISVSIIESMKHEWKVILFLR
jgi:hypothetical protein